MKAKKRAQKAEVDANAWHPAARKLGEAVRFSFLCCIKRKMECTMPEIAGRAEISNEMKRLYFQVIFFLQEIGRQNSMLVQQVNKKHLLKTRTGLLAAWEFAKFRCDIKFDTV